MFLSMSKKKEKVKDEIALLNQTKQLLELEVNELKEEKENTRHEISKSMQDIHDKYERLRMVEFGFNSLEEINYQRYVPTMDSDEIEKDIFTAESEIAFMIASEKAIIYSKEYRINGSNAKGKKFQESYGKNLLNGFNTYAASKEKSVTKDNYFHTVDLLAKNFNKFNKQGEMLGILLNPEYLSLRTRIIELKLALKIRKAEEKTKLREERKRIREQEKLLEDIAKEESRIEKERKAMDIAFAKALTDEERAEIKAKLNELDKRLDDLTYRKEHSKAGWLYIISSPSLPGMIKCGVTRRLNPTIRVKELSSSSLPYAFRTHGFVFSNDCFDLESAMHKYFDDKRVAEDREFFYITPKEAIDVLKNKFNQEVHFESEDDEE